MMLSIGSMNRREGFLDSIYVPIQGKWVPEATFDALTHIDTIEIKPCPHLQKSDFEHLFV